MKIDNDIIKATGDKPMATTSKQIIKWKKEHVKRYEFYVNLDTENEVHEHLECVPNKRQYLIDLIKNDMKKKKH